MMLVGKKYIKLLVSVLILWVTFWSKARSEYISLRSEVMLTTFCEVVQNFFFCMSLDLVPHMLNVLVENSHRLDYLLFRGGFAAYSSFFFSCAGLPSCRYHRLERLQFLFLL